jgi:hypothetical protein
VRFKISILVLFFFTVGISVKAQSLSEYPINFLSNSFNTFIQSNEIRNADSCKVDFTTYIRKNTGLFADVYQTKSQLGFNIKKSTVSFQFYSDHQGELINRSRLYINYNTRITITKKLFAFAGLTAGIINKSLGNQNTDVQGVANTFDASAILGLYAKQWMLVFSANQIPQRTITPIKYGVPLLRYYQMYGTVSTKLNQNVRLDGILMSTIYKYINPEITFGAQVKWKGNYALGIEQSNHNIANYFLDIGIKTTTRTSISLLVSYETNSNINKHFVSSLTVFNAGFVLKFK